MDQKRVFSLYFLILFAAVLLLNLLVFRPFFAILFLAIIFAVVVKPIYLHFLDIFRKEAIAAFITVWVFFLIVVLPLTFFGWQIFLSAKEFLMHQSENTNFLNQITGFFLPLRDYSSFNIDVNNYIREIVAAVTKNLGAVFSSIASVIFTFLMILISMFFLLKDSARIKNSFYSLMLLPANVSDKILQKMEVAINGVIRGQFMTALAQAIVATLGFSIFGLPNAFLWGSVVLFAALVPNIGTALVTIPAVAFLYLSGNVSGSVGLAIWAFVAVGLIDNLLGPLLIKRGLKLHPLAILISVIGGISVFGPIGFLVGPVLLALLVVIFEIRVMIFE